MAIVSTTVRAGFSIRDADATIHVMSATGAAAGRIVRIGTEQMRITGDYRSGTAIPVYRGDDDTDQQEHAAGSPVYFMTARDAFTAADVGTRGGFGLMGVDVRQHGATGVGALHDDTTAFQAAITAAIVSGAGLFVPKPPSGGYWNITNTLNVPSGTATGQTVLNVFCDGLQYGEFRWTGGNNQAIFGIIGMRDSVWQGLRPYVPTATGVVDYDLDTNGSGASSCSGNLFINCQGNNGTGINNVTFRLGHVSGGNGDISNNTFINCVGAGEAVGGTYPAGTRCLLIEGPNVLNNNWHSGGAAYVEKFYTTISGAGATYANGGNGVWFYGPVTSFTGTNFEVSGGGCTGVYGGRAEQGQRLLSVPYGAAQTAVTFDSFIFDGFTHPSGAIIDCDRPTTLILNNCRGYELTTGGGANLIHLGIGGGYGSDIFIRGGAYHWATDPMVSLFGTAGRARRTIEGVGIMDAAGAITGRMTNKSFDS